MGPYIYGVIGFLVGWFTLSQVYDDARPKPSYVAVDIEESFENLRKGCMTEADEENLRDAAEFERYPFGKEALEVMATMVAYVKRDREKSNGR